MLLILTVDIMNGEHVRLHILYVFPLAAIAIHCPLKRSQWLAFGVSLVFQIWSIVNQRVTPITLAADLSVACAASGLTLLLANAVRVNYLKALSLATIDNLTGLPNRAVLMTVIDKEIVRQKRYGGVFSLAEIDLDGFKQLNDTRGHLSGDEALQLMAQVLRRHTRQSDVAGRMGGDEFIMLMPHMPQAECQAYMQKLCDTVRTEMTRAGFQITASIGFRTFLTAPKTTAEALHLVDQAMYEAKNSGKCRVTGA
ncbi:MAG: GGDEF domain-containing protein [Rhodoferax sp.]|nr:GGDEF domain-containing protein [Rhodoferax sp.]